MASFLGYERKDKPAASPNSPATGSGKKLTASGVEELMRMFPGGNIKV